LTSGEDASLSRTVKIGGRIGQEERDAVWHRSEHEGRTRVPGGPLRDAGVRGQRRGPPAPHRGPPREGGIPAEGRHRGGGRERGGPADGHHAVVFRPARGREAGPQGRQERRQPAEGRSGGAPVGQGHPRGRREGGAEVGAIRALRRGGHRGRGGRRPPLRLGRDTLQARRGRRAAGARRRHPGRAQRPARAGLLPGGRGPAPRDPREDLLGSALRALGRSARPAGPRFRGTGAGHARRHGRKRHGARRGRHARPRHPRLRRQQPGEGRGRGRAQGRARPRARRRTASRPTSRGAVPRRRRPRRPRAG
jgi:hypothetical protein